MHRCSGPRALRAGAGGCVRWGCVLRIRSRGIINAVVLKILEKRSRYALATSHQRQSGVRLKLDTLLDRRGTENNQHLMFVAHLECP